ncbi:MAG: GGDEF domain-containing protein [bacterium]|nr:GGDEF domain-containing protein [bacterium]
MSIMELPVPPKRKELSIQSSFGDIKEAFEKGDDKVDGTFLHKALDLGQIDQDQYDSLLQAKEERDQLIIDGLTPVAKRVSDLQAEKEKLEKERHIDSLTGLSKDVQPTLDRLLKELNYPRGGESQRPYNLQAIMVIYTDLNQFKELNDSHGHPSGDKALVEFASRLKGATREGHDLLFRSNEKGDEFVVILPIESNKDVDVQSLRDLFYKLVNNVNSDLSVDLESGATFDFSASMGYSVATRGGMRKTARDLIKGADREMYKDKISKKIREKKSRS